MMKFLSKYGFYFFLAGILSDLSTPYILGIFYPGLNQFERVISTFGDVVSPVRGAFLIVSVISGSLLLLAVPAVYRVFSRHSVKLGVVALLSLGFYAIGDCIFTGLFSINTQQETWGISTWIHNIGSGIGYGGFLLFPFLIVIYYLNRGEDSKKRFYSILLLMSLFFAAVYGFARVPEVNHLPFLNQLGLCQRVSYLFTYLPAAFFAWNHLRETGQELSNEE